MAAIHQCVPETSFEVTDKELLSHDDQGLVTLRKRILKKSSTVGPGQEITLFHFDRLIVAKVEQVIFGGERSDIVVSFVRNQMPDTLPEDGALPEDTHPEGWI